jgi:diguanylate cyclase (GGDEF)-like protein
MSDEGHETLGLEAGAVDYITKPFKDTIVKLRVKTHLELKWQRDLLDSLSHLDGLTGIANRRSFDERLDLEWRRAVRFGESLSLAIIDIDNFKIYNDTHGHLAGDECLRRVARTLADTLNRAGDFIARYGGEEFVFLLPGIDTEGLQAITEKLRANVEALHIPHGASDVSPWVTVSAGAARCYPSPGISPTTIIDSADEQLYRAKKLGKNRFCPV